MRKLSCLTLNVHGWRDYRRRSNIPEVCALLSEHQVDIAGLQEVKLVPGLRECLAATGYRLEFFKLFTDDTGLDTGLGFAAKDELEFETQALEHGEEQRGVLSARIRRGDRGLTVLNTHLSPNKQERNHQLVQLTKIIQKSSRDLIVLGDFNYPWRVLFTGVLSSVSFFTFPSILPVFKLDRIYYSSSISLVGANRIRTLLSDHLPLKAEFEL